jgi:hypothetical protein
VTLGVLSPEDQDGLLNALANAIVDTMIATYGKEQGCIAALAAVDRICAPALRRERLAEARAQCAELGISADSPVDLGPGGEQLAAAERADYSEEWVWQ